MQELVLRKRKAHEGEIGLFAEQPFEDEMAALPLDRDIKAECTVPGNLKYLRFYWALVTKVSDNSPSQFMDKQDCSDRILLAARHFKTLYDPKRDKAEVRPKSVAGLSADSWIRLLRRVTYVVVTEYLPGVDESSLKAEIELMIGSK